MHLGAARDESINSPEHRGARLANLGILGESCSALFSKAWAYDENDKKEVQIVHLEGLWYFWEAFTSSFCSQHYIYVNNDDSNNILLNNHSINCSRYCSNLLLCRII